AVPRRRGGRLAARIPGLALAHGPVLALRRRLQGLGSQRLLDLGDALARQLADLALRLLEQVSAVVLERLAPITGEQVRLGDVEQQPRARLELVRELILADRQLVLVAFV